MKRKIIISLVLTLIIVGGTFASYVFKNILNENEKIETKLINTSTGLSSTGNLEEEIILSPEEIKIQKIEALRRKLALRGLILKGDINLKSGEYTSALVKYLQIHKEIPEDESIVGKLGDTYYSLQKYKQAYGYYSQIKDYKKLDKDKAAKTLIFSVSLNDKNIEYINNELVTLGLSEDQLFYYSNSLECKNDFSLCKQNFQDYFKNIENIETGTGETIEVGTGKIIEEIKFKELENIRIALENYENFQIDDLLYKGALVSGAFFENGLYPIAIVTSKTLLEEKDDYKPLLKVVAKSYYELGDYINAKLYLIDYNKLVKNDAEVSYFLGVVYERLHEYVLSTIHFKKAIKIGSEDSIDINRRILFNYYELGEIEKMLETFKLILNEESDKLTTNDYNLAIYYNIVNDEIKDAKIYTQTALEIFPESEIFNGYMGWILMDEINAKPELVNSNGNIDLDLDLDLDKNQNINPYEEAETYINKGLEINTKSPMLNLVKGKIEISKGDIKKAFIFFKKTLSLDKDGDFGKIAKQELENIEITNK